ncbi:MAG: DUF3365 domain-containing protein, partial [Nitrospina sp.]|nr:DUF3365 domain-containing protein [Nitrospina sp.]
KRAGLNLSMDPDQESHPVIPFPATFTRMVNEKFQEIENFSVNILSNSPVNPDQGLKDSVDKEGFSYLKNNPNATFKKVFEQQGKLVVNIYTPDKASTEGCVSCHTAIKNKPFKIGDMLGIRKFSLVYSEDIAIGKAELNADLKEFIKNKSQFMTTLEALQSGGSISMGRHSMRLKTVMPVRDQNFQDKLKFVQAQFGIFENLTNTLITLDVASLEFRRTYQEILKLSTRLTEHSNDLAILFVGIADKNQQRIKEAIVVSVAVTLFLLSSLYYYLSRFVLSPVITVSNRLALLARGI